MPPEAAEAVGQIPDWVGALADLGLIGWLILSIWALLSGRVITREAYLEERADVAAELARREAQHERELRDKEAAAVAWKQLYERADEERRANGRELAEQLRTLDMALELVKPR